MDMNWSGTIDIVDIDQIFNLLGETGEDMRLDLDENGIIDMMDVVIFAQYVGLSYRGGY